MWSWWIAAPVADCVVIVCWILTLFQFAANGTGVVNIVGSTVSEPVTEYESKIANQENDSTNFNFKMK